MTVVVHNSSKFIPQGDRAIICLITANHSEPEAQLSVSSNDIIA